MDITQGIAIGDKITIDIRKQGINGEGIGYFHKMAIFVPGAIVKETVTAEIIEIRQGFAMAKIIAFLQQSIRRIQPQCPYYEKCGGCQLLHIAYLEQLKIKQSILIQSLKRYTEINVDTINIRKTAGMKENFGYRNKSQMPFKNTNLGLELGLYETNSNRFVTVDSCMVQDPIINHVNQTVLKILIEYKMMAFDQMNPEGILLNLVTRYVKSTDEVQITLIVSAFKPILKDIAKKIMASIPTVKGVFYSVNKQHNPLMFGKTIDLMAGLNYVSEKIDDLTIKLSPEAFHQLNNQQMKVLYAEIIKACELTGNEIIVDAFCGVGISSMQMAKKAKMVYGIDYAITSIKDATTNAAINKISNCVFLADRVEKKLPELISKKIKPDVIVFDPPRSGLDDAVINELRQAKIPRIVYVSCNPSTLAKNIAKLLDLYEIKYIQPIDMFPHTSGVESVTLLKLSNQ